MALFGTAAAAAMVTPLSQRLELAGLGDAGRRLLSRFVNMDWSRHWRRLMR